MKRRYIEVYKLKYRLLTEFPFFQFLNRWCRASNWLAYLKRKSRLGQYFEDHAFRKINFGCGRNHMSGWLNADICHGEVYVDATKKLPIEDESVHYIFCEHFIEHLPYLACTGFFRECYRVLAKGGVLRASTPDLRFYIDLYIGEEKEVSLEMFSSRIRHIFPNTPDRCTFINRILYEFGHLYNWDYDKLSSDLHVAGFRKTDRQKYGLSKHQELSGLESHSSVEWYQSKATLIIEAEK